MSIKQTLAKNIRENDLPAYQKNRYDVIPDGGELVFEDEDFSHVDFSEFSLGFVIFRRCILRRARSLRGQPITIEDCDARELDLRGVSTVINAVGSDFTEATYDTQTILAIPENGTAGRSSFIGCQLDVEMARYLLDQGVLIR